MTSSARVRPAVLPFLLVAAFVAVRLTAPDAASACSCAITGPDAIGSFGGDPSVVVFVGTVLSVDPHLDAQGHSVGQLRVERVFKGPIDVGVRPVIGGGGGDCTIAIAAGQRMVTAATWDGTAITPGLCRPIADPATAQGEALIAAAVAAYGTGSTAATEDPPTRPAEGQAPDGPLLAALALALGTAILLFGGLAMLTRRRRTTS